MICTVLTPLRVNILFSSPSPSVQEVPSAGQVAGSVLSPGHGKLSPGLATMADDEEEAAAILGEVFVTYWLRVGFCSDESPTCETSWRGEFCKYSQEI